MQLLPRRFGSYLIVSVFLVFAFTESQAQDFTLSSDTVKAQANKAVTVDVLPVTGTLAVADVTLSLQPAEGATVTKEQSDQKVKLTITVTQPQDYLLSVTAGTLKKIITIRPVFQADNLPFTDLRDPLPLVRNDPKIFLVKPGVSLQGTDLKVASTKESIALANFDGKRLTITPLERGSTQVTITNIDDLLLKTINVTVTESPRNVRPDPSEIEIDKDAAPVDWFEKIKLIGGGGDNVTDELKGQITLTSPREEILRVEGTKLRAVKQGDVQLRLSAAGGISIAPVLVHVTAKPTDATFSISTGTRVLRPAQTVQVTAKLKNEGEEVHGAQVTKWDYADEASKARISFVETGPNTISVTALPGASDGSAALTAFYGKTPPDRVEFTIEKTEVVAFKPLQIRFDILDEQTARDLFGKKAADDFHIAKIRLFNKLRDATNIGNSILVYGESLEVNVALEEKGADGRWTTIDKDKMQEYFGFEDPEPKYFARSTDDEPEVQKCERVPQKDFIARYRPMTFEMITNTHDRRDDRSTRSRILLIMNSTSSLVSFITSIAVPGPSSDLPLGLDKFRNLLIPSFERLFPSMKEVQRQNIVSMAMKPLEEVPFGSDISRIVFFPKKPIRGALPRKQIRIGAIAIADSCAEVAIVKKAGQP
jgi:hypothetical protein